MNRTRIRLALAAVLLAAALTSTAAASSPPRGVLSKVEYQELHATDVATKQASLLHGTPTHIARSVCRALTGATRLTAAEHQECEASLIFFYRFYAFLPGLTKCLKLSTVPARISCTGGQVHVLQEATATFIRKDEGSRRATAARGFSQHCLAYLILTPRQKQSLSALHSVLPAYARAIKTGNAAVLVPVSKRLATDFAAAQKAMALSITVSACRHA